MSWAFPVLGKTEWSGGGWMPNTQNHRGRTHAAIDIYASKGQTIISPVKGVVKYAASTNVGGNWIQILGDDGNVYYFAHMDKPTTLSKGDRVSGGSTLGFVGNSGSASSTSPHLHFSIKKNGKALNPATFLKSGVVVPDIRDYADRNTGAGSAAAADSPGQEWSGVQNAPPGYFADIDWTSANADEPLSPQAQDSSTPAWFDQLAQYRQEVANRPQEENPTKVKAQRVMHGTLTGMANMVRNAGFQTGIGESEVDVNTISREEGER